MTSSRSAELPARAELQSRANQVYPAMVMLAGMQLDIFTQFKNGPLEADTVARSLGVEPRKLSRLLYALVASELLEVEGGLFSNSPLADHLLVKGKPSYAGGVHELWSDLWSATLKTAETIRTGVPQAKHDFENISDEEIGAFLRGQHSGAIAAGRILGNELRFNGCLLDVGGGSGGLAMGACEVVPNLTATVAELPAIAPTTRKFLTAAGVTDRIDVVPVNLVTTEMDGTYDVAILRNLLQTMAADDGRRLIQNVGKTVVPGGRIHVLGFMLEDSRLSPRTALNFDIVFLNIYDDGAAYTIGDQQSWLEAAGFSQFECGPVPAGSGSPGTMLISATKSANGVKSMFYSSG